MTGTRTDGPRVDRRATDELATRIERITAAAADPLERTRALAPMTGATPQADGGVRVLAWVPRATRATSPASVELEVLDAVDGIDLTASTQTARFRRTIVPLEVADDVAFGVVSGVGVGRRDRIGSFYCLRVTAGDEGPRRALDPMATSLPFGAFAPAEVYDLGPAQRDRGDAAYWRSLAATAGPDRCGPRIVKIGPTCNILEVHVPTATDGGTIADLAAAVRDLAATVEAGEEPTLLQRCLLGYDAFQLMPVEPTTAFEAGPAFWSEREPDGEDGIVTVDLRRPDTTNWGYDVVIAGSAAVNPTLLATGRPDELVDLAVALHTFPTGPIRLVADVVYGHSDNQGLDVLDGAWFAGPNMYGQDMAFREPWVRALLLEMQRRKVDLGFDAVRVDGAQDFTYDDPQLGGSRHDDEYLQLMSDVVQEVAGCRYRPWMIFEDGRPWPDPDWELASTYREVTLAQLDDDVFQWGPLTFAHNTPFVVSFWLRAWWRIEQVLAHGANWISGCANHDTLRRGGQVDPERNLVNRRLGDSLPEILDVAYDNPGITALTHCALPGVPMEFLNATTRASWGFIRNVDDRWGVKVLSEETITLRWQVDEEVWARPGSFARLKAQGFGTLAELRRFGDVLPACVAAAGGDDLEGVARLLQEVDPPLAAIEPVDVPTLKHVARAWMDDMHDLAVVTRWAHALDDDQTAFTLAARRFRLARRWLRDDLGPDEDATYLRPVLGSAVVGVLRRDPTGAEQVLTVVNLEGRPTTVDPTVDVGLRGLPGDGWAVALRTPGVDPSWVGGPVELTDHQAVVLTRPGQARGG